MATQGIVSSNPWETNYGKTRYIELEWERTAYDVNKQTSTIKWTLKGAGTYTGYVKSAPFDVYIDGTQVYYSTTRISLNAGDVIASGTKTIKHNTDGTKKLTISIAAAIYSSAINSSGTKTFDLDIVGKATITAAPNFNDEENPTISYFNPVGTTLDTLQACISLTGESPNVAYRDIPKDGSTYTFNLTTAERDTLRAATQGANTRKVKFFVKSIVAGTTYLDYKEVSFTVINANPTITASVIDTNETTVALTGSNTTLIKYHSTAQAAFTATPKKQATISTTVIEHNGSLNSGTELTTENVEGKTFAFIASDSRGNTVSETIVAPMIDYIKPTINIDTAAQMDTSGNYPLTISGNYFNNSFGAAANSLTVRYRYKAQGGTYGSWTTITATKDGNSYTANATITGLDYRTTYTIHCLVKDKLNTIYSAQIKIRSLPVFHWSETDFVFEVPVNFNDGININGETFNAGQWQPTLTTAAAVSSYSVRQGWYQKVGNVITVGWQLKATINSGYNTTAVAISGLPFTPAFAAFGGGIAHNVYLAAGFCFEGWAAGTDGNITLRGQPCNNTAAGNLQITSTAYYPTGSNSVITLAGTITYMING